MSFTPHTPEEIREMLAAIGVGSIGDLFRPIPKELRARSFDLPPGMSEFEMMARLQEMAGAEPPRRSVRRRRLLRPRHPRGGGPPGRPCRVLHRLYPLPARMLPGDLAGALRVPDRHLPSDRPGSLQRLALRRRHGLGRGRHDGAAGHRPRSDYPGRRGQPLPSGDRADLPRQPGGGDRGTSAGERDAGPAGPGREA